MTWTYQSYDDSDIDKIIDSVNGFLGSLSGSDSALVAQGVKAVVSDQEDGDARGVVFFDPAVSSVPDPLDGNISWNKTTKTTRNDYTDLYNDILDELKALDSQTAFWSKISFTNRREGEATLTIYYPQAS